MFALFTGGPGALSLTQTVTSADAPSPTSLSFAGVTDGMLSFYASTEGRETATLLAFNLDEGGSTGTSVSGDGSGGGSGQSTGQVLASATAGMFQQVAQLLGRSGSPLDLVAPLFTVSVLAGEFDVEASGEGGLALLAGFTPAAGPGSAGQSLKSHDDGDDGEEAQGEPTAAEPPPQAGAADTPALPIWKRMSMGLEKAWEQVRSDLLKREGLDPGAADRESPPAAKDAPPPSIPGHSSDHSDSKRPLPGGAIESKAAAMGKAIEEIVAERDELGPALRGPSHERIKLIAMARDRTRGSIVAAIAVAGGATIGTYLKPTRFSRSRRRNHEAPAEPIGV
jgi:hypothetical protein